MRREEPKKGKECILDEELGSKKNKNGMDGNSHLKEPITLVNKPKEKRRKCSKEACSLEMVHSEEAHSLDMGHLFDVTVMGPCEAILKEPTRGA